MRVGFKFVKKLYLLKENKFVHFILKYDFFYALTFSLLTFNFINITVPTPNNMIPLKLFVQLFISTHKFDVLWLKHFLKN